MTSKISPAACSHDEGMPLAILGGYEVLRLGGYEVKDRYRLFFTFHSSLLILSATYTSSRNRGAQREGGWAWWLCTIDRRGRLRSCGPGGVLCDGHH